jgi:hypothetical protein
MFVSHGGLGQTNDSAENRGTPSFTDVKLLVWPNSTNEVLPVDIKCSTQFNALIKVGHCKCFPLNGQR